MALAKPANFIDWTDGDAAKQVEPSAGKKLLGWVALERPPFEFMNHLFFRLDEWQHYFESVTDELVAGTPDFDAVVGSGPGTFADINAAVAAVSAGSSILVRTSQTIDAVQIINKANIRIEFHPSAVINRGTSVTGIRIDAAGVFLHMGRFNNFVTGGDVALDITANGDNCHILNNRFAVGTDTEIADIGANNVKLGNITEV